MTLKSVLLMFALLSLAFAQATEDTAPAIPSDFPKDIPVYKGAKVQTWYDKSPIKVLYLEVKADKADIMGFYKRELAAKGWKVGKAFGGSPDALQAVMGNGVISMGLLERNRLVIIQIGLLPPAR